MTHFEFQQLKIILTEKNSNEFCLTQVKHFFNLMGLYMSND